MQFNFNYNSLSFIILIIFGVCLIVQLLYHWSFFTKVAFYKRNARPKLNEELEPVSIVLCARDAYEYLVDLIPALLKQDYPDFEIVVVNDCSDDETEEYLKDLERNEPRVKPVQLKQHLNFFNGKKFPLSMGIKSAKNDLIIFTDCNCMPLNRIMRFDALQNGLLYLSAALCHHPYMGIGKNLSYRKELFYRKQGFISHYTTSVGDDDLFINQAATKKNTEVLIDAEDAILATPPSTFHLWARQKSSRYSTIPQYDGPSRLMLSGFYVSQFLFYASFIALLALCAQPAFAITNGAMFYIPILVFFFLLRFGTQLFIYHKASKRLGEKGLLPGLIVYDFLFAFLSPWLRLMGRMNVGVE